MAHELNAGGTRFGDVIASTLGWLPGMLADPIVFQRWRWLHRTARRGARTLDAGCGAGWFAFYLASIGNEVLGVSFDPTAIAAAKRRADARGLTGTSFLQGDLRELDRFGESLGTFDLIICFETIEHIRDDAKLVRDLAARLNPGGRLMLTTPSDDHPALIGEELSETEDGGHVRFGYSLPELRALCEAAGLRVIEEAGLGGWVVQKLFNITLRMVPALGFLGAEIMGLTLRPLQLFDRPITALLGYPKLCVSMIAERPAAAHRFVEQSSSQAA
jgi:SAM-dependent methyltransferase